nr:BLUF domain-containing protein [uncultured Sulfurimonas sp.]
MKQIIYTSEATAKVDLEVIDEILDASVGRNKQAGLSGLLVFDGKIFLQCIEGENKKIDELMKRIAKDDRHTNIKILGSKDITQRSFASWSMGYIRDIEAVKKIISQSRDSVDWNYIQAHKVLMEAAKII